MSGSQALDRVRYVMAVWMAIAAPPALGYWLVVHPFVGFWRRRGPRATFWALGIFFVAAISALWPWRVALIGRDLGTSAFTIALALPLMVASAVVSRKRRRYLSFVNLAGLGEIAPDRPGPGLLTEGIYARIRHPRYVEFTLGLLAWGMFSNYLGLYVEIVVVLAALLLVLIPLEERELRARFGQSYLDYSSRVPRFIPRRR